jgi:hypothetical protein
MMPVVVVALAVMVMPVLRADVGQLTGSRVLLGTGLAGRVGCRCTCERRSTHSHRDKEILHVITPVEMSCDNRWASGAFRPVWASKRRRCRFG